MARDAGALVRSLLALRKERRTGVFIIDADGIRTTVFLMDGSAVFAEEAPGGETLGRLLVRQGVLTSEQYASVIQIMADAPTEQEQLRFGEVAIELGFITGDQLNEGLADQVRWRVVRAFQRADHEWRFEEGRDRVDGVPLYELSFEPLVLLALRSSADPDVRGDAPGSSLNVAMARFPVLSDDAETIARTFELTPTESAFVAAIDGKKRTADVLRMGRPGIDREQILTALLLTRSLKLVDVAGDEPPSSARSPQPPSSPHRPAAASAPSNEHAPSSVQEPARAPVVKTSHAASLEAELAFQRGKNLLRSRQASSAVAEFRRALALVPLHPEFELYARWAEVEVNRGPLDNAHKVALQRLAIAASRHDPNLPFPVYVLGRIAGFEGHEADAKRWLERAYRMDPKLREAESESAPTEPEKRGVLGWLRGDKETK